MSRIVILGLGSGGFAALMAIRRTDPEASITIVEKRENDMFSPCGMPFAIEGIIGLEELIFSLPEDKKILKLLMHEVVKIDSAEKNVYVKNLKTMENSSIPYDSLIIALGASPFIPLIEGVKENFEKCVFVLNDIKSAQKIIEYAKIAKKALIVGAGPIGLEIAIALRKNGLDVIVVEMLSHAFPRTLDRDMAKIVERSLQENEISFLMDKRISRINGPPLRSVSIGDESIECDMVILASGVRANLDVAKNAGIEIGKWGIKTDPGMETNIKGIYAVGDCIETVSLIDHRPTITQLSSPAYRQGLVAGTNAAGGYDTYEGALGTFVSVVGELEVAATGFNEFFAESAGFKIISGKAHGKTRPEYYPEAKDITVKLIADSKTGKLIGAQAAGEGAAARINVLSLAIRCGMSVQSLCQTEMAYCPILAENYDVINKAADFIVRKLEKAK